MLKRSNAIWDLTAIPLDAPLTLKLTINIQVGASAKSMSLTNLDSLVTVLQLKRLIEPLAYNMYLDYIKSPNNAVTTFYQQVKSPVIQSPTSDYGSESGIEVDDATLMQGNVENFLHAMILQADGKQVTDAQRLYELKLKKFDTVTCTVDLTQLIQQ